MFLPLPNLDDRRWIDLVDEAQSVIPFFAPRWTDHNLHDPGITLTDLFAWVTEMDLFQVNQIPERHRLKFLSLVNIHPAPPVAAHVTLSLSLQDQDASISLPAGLEFEGNDSFGQMVRFRTLYALKVLPAQLRSVQWRDRAGVKDLTQKFEHGEPLNIFGDDPQPGAELYLGFDRPLSDPANTAFTLYFTVDDWLKSHDEHERLVAEIERINKACHTPPPLVECDDNATLRSTHSPKEELYWVASPFVHHSVRIVWEFMTGAKNRKKQWQWLDPADAQIVDETRAFTLNGRVVVQLPSTMAQDDETGLYWLRCRFVEGTYDAPPSVRDIAVNGVLVEQAVTPGSALTELTDRRGLSVEWVGVGDGWPNQQVALHEAPAIASSLRVYTLENGCSQEWTVRPDFDASKLRDYHVTLDATTGALSFGDGEHGCVVSADSEIYVAYLATKAEAGNLAARTITKLADSAHNRAALPDFDNTKARLHSLNRLSASGGATGETLAHAEGRALQLIEQPTHAITLSDYEYFARLTPGVRLARVTARANFHPSFASYKAPGLVTVIVLPFLPTKRPLPSVGLLSKVKAHLNHYRIIGTRIEVIPPNYVEVTVRAQVQARAGTSTTKVRLRVTDALRSFFDPLAGGPDGVGWPFGRDVYRSEVMQVISDVDVVDHVITLVFVGEDGEPTCGDVCVGLTGLVADGEHVIEVVQA